VPVLALALAACGGGGGPGSSVDYGHGDTATFVIDGRTITVTESGRASVDVPAAPEVRHDGPVGCGGRYFTADFVANVRLFFRYGSQDAYLLVGSDLYYLGEPPQRSGGSLSWNTTSGGHQIQIQADCPPPSNTGPLTAARTPAACSVLTPAVAQQAVRRPVGPPKFVQENPDLSYCAYTSRNKSFGGSRRVSVSVGSAEVIEQLISWQAPRISGLGDEAHGADASDGLAVRQAKLGLEVTVDLGESASNAENLAAEETLARRLLGRLPG
jgi:hypothetical protein